MLFLCVLCACPVLLLAQDDGFEYTVSITETVGSTEVPVEGVQVKGNNGVSELAGLFTGIDGNISFDIRDLLTTLDTALVFHREGYSFEPSEISLEDCVGGVCYVTASRTNPSALVRVLAVDQNGDPIQDVDTFISGTPNGCTRKTDSNGVAYFSIPVRANLAACNDTDAIYGENDYNTVFATPKNDGRCSLQEIPAISRNLCIRSQPSGTIDVVVTGTCAANPSPPAPLAAGRYSIPVILDSGAVLLNNLQIYPVDQSVYSSQNGNSFDITQYGLSADQTITVFPVGSRSFYPKSMVVNRTTCPGGYCQPFRAKPTSTLLAQHILPVDITDSNDEGVSGVRIVAQGEDFCSSDVPRFTNGEGRTHVAAVLRQSCTKDSDYITIKPSLPGYAFSHDDDFRFCPTSVESGFVATAVASEPSAFHTVSGRITTSLNESFSRVQIVKNGSTAALTRDDGTYSVTVEHGVTTVLQPVYEGYVFNKEEVQILEPSHNISELNFKMIATVDGDPFGPTPPACNPTNGVFTISGFVINSVGQRVSGVKILNEGEMVAITGVDGSYSFPASPGDNLWVTAQYVDPISGEEALFDPSAIAEPILACDKTDFNFMVSDEEAYILSGVVTNEETGEPLESVKISFNLDGEIQTTTSSADGFFLLTTTADDWTATPDNVNYHCTPSSYSGEGGANQAQLDFVCRFDECPTDPSKDEAGQCGCGTPDVDADNDGTAACLDQCDSDPLKIDPGTCGCGISEVDSDNDGTPDCVDECPADSSKSTAGVCGCGTLDDPSDSDGDGTADCADLCIHDPGKTEPGVCGCGTADSDSDLDGTADCNDACPLDDRKTTVGICGCGVSDYDSDGDGTPDCNDQCDHDVKKTAPGICGCGVVDKDTDNDGAYDCNETCDNDPLKTAPGICGCGTPDTDSDGDGVADCNDQCPTDANKSAPGICGCGSIDSAIDSDGDGVPNCNDSCPNDAGKTQPGQCGCGIADVDVDGDGTASCHDQCDSDANKLEPGFCGCGTLDTDTDGDGTPNCNDGCPSDANKVAPGQCGCGVIDRDRDGDGTYDCNDECPTDPSKTAAGSCGCFVAETDSDLDGIADCNDECPMDPEKTTPGHCGCMIPDEDLNNDGIYDCPVNCENPVVVDFDLNGLLAGTMVSDQFAELGVTIRVESTTNSAVLFNSAAPTGGDLDLGAANERFGGPGIGSGINAGDGNETILNNILVIAKSIDDSNLDGLVDNPSNDPAGGRIIFDFERPSSVVSIDILDLDETNDGASLEAIQAPAQMTSAMEEEALSKGKITICHFPPGNPANMRTIEIALSAWDAHEAHGDHVGECIPRQVSPSTVKGFMLDAEVYSKNLSARGDNAKETHYLETRFYVQRLETTFGESAGLAQITFCPTDDECFFDDNKTEPGQCGCGVADTDTDGDGTADCNDQCSNDPTKTSPGSCGCGVLDVDGDGDGTPDCQDSCKSDPNKIAPGACGCGKLDVDTDNDGQLDCKEECPNDPLKTAAGQCGCGVPETDSDLDGTPDCVDLCSAVVQKIAPGQCGCGVVDIDTDGDGVADCVDQCVADPNKSSPGACGCGTADTDTDGDGTPDCQDQCKNDRNKTIPGTCGCGTPDKDSDRDGVLDCNDSCAADPLKSSPGVCGCGVADTDSDGDGFLDCNDSCPTDPSKTTQGVCGCGVAEIDSDGDGTPNCADECLTDAGKIFAGACGCGHPDTDSDDDGVADCIDLCPVDPGKSNAGVCGCGVSDKDTDKDGTADCQDSCPSDKNKVGPGICGCGISDADSDRDGLVDCEDLCPADPGKIEAGICGCGISDADSDRDGTVDCEDLCPSDGSKVTPGQCGCGKSDVDSNGNGLADCNEKPLELEAMCLTPGSVGPPVPGAPPEADLCANGATEVLRYVVGTGANGNPVDSSRQDTAKALGVPERNDTDNFVSLGRGGLIELGFSGRAIWNKEGFDLEIVETSWGHRGRPCSTYPEYVEAYATADGNSWHTLGVICRDGKLQLDLAGLPYATAIRLEDRTTMEASDGFDVDGIGCIASSTSAAVPSGSPEDGDNGLRAAFTSGSSSEVTAANVALCTGEGTTLIVTEDAAPEYFLKGATEGRCEESLQSFTRAAMDASTVEMCFKITNKNPADYETLGWKFSWQASATKLETVGPNSEVIVCTNVNPQPTFELYENGKLQSSVTHPLKECKRTLGKFVASVALFGTNGDPLTTRQLSTFEDLDMYFEAKNLQSNERTLLRLEEPYLGSIELAEGDYKFSLIAPGATITSKPKSFRMKGIETDTLFRWAIRGKGARVKKGRKGRSGR